MKSNYVCVHFRWQTILTRVSPPSQKMIYNFEIMLAIRQNIWSKVVRATLKYGDPRSKMAHLGWALKRHFEPQVHHISMSHSLPCIICILSLCLYTSWAFINHLRTMCHIMQYVSRTCSFKRKKFFVQCTTTTTTVLRPLYRSTCVSRHFQLRTAGHFVGSKFYCPHALADGNQRIRFSE